jgi:uncharacterized protein YndB with AHSA1/START domain
MTTSRTRERTDSASIEVAATPDALYAMFSDAAKLMKWLPPATMRGRALEYDFREGGRYRIELVYGDAVPSGVAKTGERTDVSAGRFLRLEPGRCIVQSVEFESEDPAFSGEMTMTWLLEPAGSGTKVTVVAEHVPRGISKSDHEAGIKSSLENLAKSVR